MLQRKIAVIADDDKETLRPLVSLLEEEGYEVALALDNQHALQLIKKAKPSIVVSEIGKSNYDGLKLFDAYKKESAFLNGLKMIILTNSQEEKHEIQSFELGIDDYLIKPLRTNAFKKRIKLYFKKDNVPQKEPLKHFQARDLHFDLLTKSVLRLPEGNEISIQSKTFDILFLLASNSNQIFSREAIIREVWKPGKLITGRTVDVHILKIRQTLGESYIKTVKGVGYIFVQQD